MNDQSRTTANLLAKLNIDALKPMQEEAISSISANENTLLLSPTGSGKTLAFLIPIIQQIDTNEQGIQALILSPSRELAIQIEQVLRSLGSGLKANAVYGGRPIKKDFEELNHSPAILIGTPGRVLDHLERESIDVSSTKFLVLDEFDKSLEVGFEEQMKEILYRLRALKKRVLTSATKRVSIPGFVNFKGATTIDYSSEKKSDLSLFFATGKSANKMENLAMLLSQLSKGQGIVFCNFKDDIDQISTYLEGQNIEHVCFFGGMDQRERERALIKFRNGSSRIMLATDLAARGLDIPEIQFIVHYQLPFHKEEFVHRNGRTARMHAQGAAYILRGERDELKDYLGDYPVHEILQNKEVSSSQWSTLFLSGGRKDKISKGDIAGFLIKTGGLKPDELGLIELKQDCAFVAVSSKQAEELCKKVNNLKLKKRKLRVYTL